jgi:tetratricopeptide (TPR) repeat protein
LGELPPPPPRACFGRDDLIEKIVGLTENLEPVALIGAGGIGKTSIALSVLHNDRIVERFGDNRRFIRCNEFPPSRAHFLSRLSEVIGAGVENPKSLTPLRPFLTSKEMFIVLDNAESILDPQGSNAQEIYAVVDELCRFKKLSLCITSRITTVPRHCKRPEIPTLSMESARDIFCSIYGDGGRSNIVNGLLRRLDFHALSTTLLATTASHNAWDNNRLIEEWDTYRAQVLRTDYNESLAATIELSLDSPTFRKLGPDARDLLGVVAFFPQGVDETNLDRLFPTVSNRKNILDKFCVLSLAYRSNGFITTLAPLRDYLSPRDPKSSPILRATKDHYFARLSVVAGPARPGFREARWIKSEDANVEHLLDVFSSIDTSSDDVWDACMHFIKHLYWHKPRETVLRPKIENLPDDHRFKSSCLSTLSMLFELVGNHAERKHLLTHSLALVRERGDETDVALTLRGLSDANRWLGLHKEGIQQVQEALDIFERLGDTMEKARCFNILARLLLDDGQLDSAEDAAFRTIGLIPEKDNEYIHCQSHRNLGNTYRSKGDKGKAIHHFKTALKLASPFDWQDQLFWIHYSLAFLFRDEHEYSDARAHVEQAKSHAAENHYNLGRAMEMQALIWHRQRRFEDTKLEALGALEMFEKLGAAREAKRCRDFLQVVEEGMKASLPVSSSKFPETTLRPPINSHFSAHNTKLNT